MIVRTLVSHGVERAYIVPGESYLDVLDGLDDSPIDTVVCRHEGGAAYMAEADGKMNPRPGIAMVTRGPGAANAHVGLHTAWQDSTPMVLFVGLIPFEHREKEAFQEFDPKAWFGTGAKRVMILDHAERASEVVAEAMFAAMSGRPGPVVVGLPEDIIKRPVPTDLLVFVGTVPGDVITDGFAIRQNWDKKNFLVTIDPSLRGRSGPVSHQIVAKPDVFVRDLVRMELPVKDSWREWTTRMRAEQEKFAALPDATPGDGQARMSTLMAQLVPTLPRDAMVTFGAGEHTNWAHRYFPTNGYASMVSARNGSMGYSIPSAVAASLASPGRRVVSIAGDGEFLMNGQELATAAQYGATPLVIVMDNQEYGTIRTHQERDYPHRVSGTQLKNPDFALMATAFAGFGIRVEDDADVPAALQAALAAIDDEGRFALIHLIVEQRVKAY